MGDADAGKPEVSDPEGRRAPRLSRRLDWHTSENALAQCEAETRANTPPEQFYDLTNTNPTRAELPFSEGDLQAAWAASAGTVATYEPSPQGSAMARTALAADLQRRGIALREEHLLLTASSSEAYGYLFKLLADPGDVVLVPSPSYPLFDYLAKLEGVIPVPYRFWHTGADWVLDDESVSEALQAAEAQGRRVAALVAVSPNNPTGHWLSLAERRRLETHAERHGFPLIVDEVFQDFALDGRARSGTERCAASDAQVLTFSLGGLSKSVGLPQLKLGWIAVGGPRPAVASALQGLATLADTYLSVATPAQAALPALLALGEPRRRIIQERLLTQRAAASTCFAGSALSPLSVEGGWSLLVRVPAWDERGLGSDEAWALQALRRRQTLVQPGFFFDLTGGPFVVLSLLCAPRPWQQGLTALRDLAAR